MFENFILKYFSENSFLELANACLNEAGVYFARNTSGGVKSLISSCKDEELSAYLLENRAEMEEESKTDNCHFLVALPYSHKAFPAPFFSIVDQCLKEVAFLSAFERVFREREESKKKLSENERSELTAVIKILACAARADLDFSSEERLCAFLGDKDLCLCVGYDVVFYFRAYSLGLASGYLKTFLDCVPLLKEKRVQEVITSRAAGN